MDNRIKVYFSTLSKYKNKLLSILFFEIYYTLKYRDYYYKIHNHDLMTDALPCPYFFLHEISKFIKKNSISNIIDLGSGTGRVVNFLANSTGKNITGYEVDQELINYSLSKKKYKNANFLKEDFTLLNFEDHKIDCYIYNSPLKKEEDMIEFIRKIQNVKRKYFLLVINIDSHLDENKLSKLFENFEMIKFIKAGETKTLRIYQNKL
tara:strand:+ start:640 stop:1260 length:621 start_codon:yes stop_codon:yes gene_type:complete